ncbi:MAG: ABC transporter permease [Actinobacteria bacterium HGW-Actinobacteria-1]|jgi:ABC-2 type transport system permease protein|nr:MAG: ABC transporter permease [Actinobacteria bacterium HGW-Actinobacteria-1]
MRRFWVLLRKEIKELVTPQILLPFAITIVMFMFIGNIVGSQGTEAQANRRLALLDLDKSAASAALQGAVEQAGFKIDRVTTTDPAAATTELSGNGGTLLLVVPKGYGASLAAGKPAPLDVYSVIRTFSFMAGQDSSTLSAALAAVEQAVARETVGGSAPNLDAAFLENPLQVRDHVLIGDKQADVSPDVVMGFITSQTTFVPIVLFIVVIFAAQMVAVAIATEKENKTLETLLAMPISRPAIVTAKMVAAGLVALLSAAGYMVGMRFYMDGLMKGLGGAEGAAAQAASQAFADKLGLTLGVGDYALLGLSMFGAILVALAFALILGAFAENVKAVQSLLAPLMVLLMVPYFLSLFIDINSLSPVARTLVLAIPFSHAFLAAPNLFLGNTGAVVTGALYELAWFVVLVLIAGRIFSSDRLLTMKLNFSRKKRTAV